MPVPEGVHVSDHPLVRARLSTLRDAATGTDLFRRTLRQLGLMVIWEATRDLPTEACGVRTPLADCTGQRLAAPVVVVPILRAGLGLAEAFLDVVPEAVVGHAGLARDEKTFLPAHYYFKVPPGLDAARVFLLDPMLATGNSAADAADELKARGASAIRLVALVGCPQGATHFRSRHPDIPIFLAALDPELNDHAYIVPGLGDAGDRYFGT